MIRWADAGFDTDWSCYPFETKQLFTAWREAEKEVVEIRQRMMHIFIKSWFKE